MSEHEEPTMAYADDTMEQLAVEPTETDMEWVYARSRRRKLSWITAVLALGLAGAVGFAAGVRVQKNEAKTTTAAASTRRGTAAPSGSGGAFSGGGATRGTVKLIDGANIYVTDASGNVIKVSTTGASVTKTDAGSVNDIHPGDTVTVVGTAGSDGTVSARTVVLGGAGLAGGGLGSRGGGAAPVDAPTAAATKGG